MQRLTRKQQQVLDVIEKADSAGRPMPTHRELCSRFGWASTGSARDYLEALVRKGYLIPAEGRARGYQIARRVEAPHVVPLIGRVPAGVPFDAVENIERQIAVPAGVMSVVPTFALRVEGESMQGAGIESGDIIFVRKRETAEIGQIVVACVGEGSDVTVKKLGRLKGRPVLLPANPAFQPIRVDAGIVIMGVVVGLFRGFERGSTKAR